MKIVFATNNQHKLEEIRSILGPQFEVVSLNDIGCHEDIPETGQTLEENALMKAQYVYDHYHVSCFADDTGLEVEALNGAPGVYSARYAALESVAIPSQHTLSHDSEANMDRLLRELGNNNNRKARFRTVIALRKRMCVPVVAPASRMSLSLKVSSMVKSFAKRGEGRASAMILSSNLKATTRPLLNLVTTSKTISVTEHAPRRNWQSI